MHDVTVAAGLIRRPLVQMTRVPAISTDLFQAWDASPSALEQGFSPIPILDTSRMHLHGEEYPLGIDRAVTRASCDERAAIDATDPPLSVVFTVCASMMAAEGETSRPLCRRTLSRR